MCLELRNAGYTDDRIIRKGYADDLWVCDSAGDLQVDPWYVYAKDYTNPINKIMFIMVYYTVVFRRKKN